MRNFGRLFSNLIIIVGLGWVVNIGAIAAFSATAEEVVRKVKEVTGGLSMLLMAARA